MKNPSADVDAPYRAAARVWATGYAVLVVLMLGIGLALTHPLDGSVGRWDEHLNRTLAENRTDGWNHVTSLATGMVNTLPAIGVAALIVGVFLLVHRRRDAANVVLALTLELLVFLSVSFVVARPRPDVPRLNSTPSTSSFPSGHTAAATVLTFAVVIGVFRTTRNMLVRTFVVVIAGAAVVLVGFGRVYRGMHHPSDVIVGALLGGACLWVAVLTVRAATMHDEGEAVASRTDDETVVTPLRTSAA